MQANDTPAPSRRLRRQRKGLVKISGWKVHFNLFSKFLVGLFPKLLVGDFFLIIFAQRTI